MAEVQRSPPNGVPRSMLWRTAFPSAARCGRLTIAVQFLGNVTGLGERIVGTGFGNRNAKLVHRQSSARSTRPARSAFRWT